MDFQRNLARHKLDSQKLIGKTPAEGNVYCETEKLSGVTQKDQKRCLWGHLSVKTPTECQTLTVGNAIRYTQTSPLYWSKKKQCRPKPGTSVLLKGKGVFISFRMGKNE